MGYLNRRALGGKAGRDNAHNLPNSGIAFHRATRPRTTPIAVILNETASGISISRRTSEKQKAGSTHAKTAAWLTATQPFPELVLVSESVWFLSYRTFP